MPLPEATLAGVRQMGEMMAEMMRSLTEGGMTRAEALTIVKDWFISTMANSQAKRDGGGDALVDYMKTLNPMEPKKQ